MKPKPILDEDRPILFGILGERAIRRDLEDSGCAFLRRLNETELEDKMRKRPESPTFDADSDEIMEESNQFNQNSLEDDLVLITEKVK